MKKFLISLISCLFILLIWNEASAFHPKSEKKDAINSNKLDNYSFSNSNVVDAYFFNNLSVLKKCAHYKSYTKLAQTESDDDEDDFVQSNVPKTKSIFAFLSSTHYYHKDTCALFSALESIQLPSYYYLSKKSQLKYIFIHALKI